MLKIVENMYIRTKNGIIRKWTKYDRLIKKWEERYNFKENYDDLSFEEEKNIISASYNIIDLIEVGDYVNGMRVLRVGNIITVILDNEENISWVKPADIKTVLTKEQFENNVYRIGE